MVMAFVGQCTTGQRRQDGEREDHRHRGNGPRTDAQVRPMGQVHGKALAVECGKPLRARAKRSRRHRDHSDRRREGGRCGWPGSTPASSRAFDQAKLNPAVWLGICGHAIRKNAEWQNAPQHPVSLALPWSWCPDEDGVVPASTVEPW